MTQKDLNILFTKYLEGQCTPEECTLVEQWFAAQKDFEIDLSQEEQQHIKNKIWNNIQKELPRKKRFNLILLGSLAASIIFILTFWNQKEVQLPNTNELSPVVQVLPDGSEITLGENAQIHYDKNFNKTHRNVTLMGNAFFNVQPDKTKPFIISSGELITEVVGTTFEILQNPELNQIEVKVSSGRVTVYNPNNKKQTKVVLNPNEKVVYNKLYKNINRTIVESPKPIVQEEKKFTFKQTPLKEVARVFHETYGIDFKIKSKDIENCKINADLEDLPMFMKLELVCKSIDVSYIIDGTTVILDGDGCNL